MNLPPPSSQPQQQLITTLGCGGNVYFIDPDEGPILQWSCRYLSKDEVLVEQKKDRYTADKIWEQCIEHGLWEEYDGEIYIVRDFVYQLVATDDADEGQGQG